MPETRPPTRTTRNENTPHVENADEAERREAPKPRRRRSARDPRAADVGIDGRETEDRGRGIGFAEELRAPDTEHKTGRLDDGSAV